MTKDEAALAVATRQVDARCPVCGSRSFEIPWCGIGVVCQQCGAWSLVNVERVTQLLENEQ